MLFLPKRVHFDLNTKLSTKAYYNRSLSCKFLGNTFPSKQGEFLENFHEFPEGTRNFKEICPLFVHLGNHIQGEQEISFRFLKILS